jgi:hypothetical protein
MRWNYDTLNKFTQCDQLAITEIVVWFFFQAELEPRLLFLD